jgi:hypothetical protein
MSVRIMPLRLPKAGVKEYDVPIGFRPLRVDTRSGEIYLRGLCEKNDAITLRVTVKVLPWPSSGDTPIREDDQYVGSVTIGRFDYFVFYSPYRGA